VACHSGPRETKVGRRRIQVSFWFARGKQPKGVKFQEWLSGQEGKETSGSMTGSHAGKRTRIELRDRPSGREESEITKQPDIQSLNPRDGAWMK
jgi:hypothetical protein